MTWAIVWEAAAERSLLAIPDWRMAESIAMAVNDLATAGVGVVERVGTDTSAPFRLRVPPFSVRFSVDAESRTLRVWAVWRSS